MSNKRSGINDFTIEELANEMLKDNALKDKIRLYCKNHNMNEQTRNHSKRALDLYRTLKAEIINKQKAETAARYAAEKKAKLEKWLENNPTTLRFKTVPEILEVLENDKTMRNKVNSYLSQKNSNLAKEYKNRLLMATIAYYIKHKPDSTKLNKHLNNLIQ